MENVRRRQNIRLIADEHCAKKAVAKPTFQSSEIINDELVMLRAKQLRLLLNKPIYVGFVVLERSKALMYEFYYDHIKHRYGPKASLLFTDTDSLCLYIETDNLYEDMKANIDFFDTSNFDQTHELYSMRNAKVLGKFKSETGSTAPSEFVGLRAKMYSLLVSKTQKPKITAKGIKKVVRVQSRMTFPIFGCT